ncbi:hypothetical protein G7Y79_00040g076750 [Physcia stellaris]|nr:hypothetical protein G7Y79_00040g076750 [Physcia stellaris]
MPTIPLKMLASLLALASLALASPLAIPTNSTTRTGLCSLPNNAALGLHSSAGGGPVCAFTATASKNNPASVYHLPLDGITSCEECTSRTIKGFYGLDLVLCTMHGCEDGGDGTGCGGPPSTKVASIVAVHLYYTSRVVLGNSKSLQDLHINDLPPGNMGYTEEAQAQHPIPHRKFDVFPPQYGGHLKDIRWRHEFEDTFGIVDYTRIFINIHEQRGVVLTRHTVELSWVQQVAKMFEDDEEKKEFMVLQLRCALINDCWIRNNFKIDLLDNSLIEDTNGVRDKNALRVLCFPKTVGGKCQTIMLLHDTEAQSAINNRYKIKTRRAVMLPFLGLHSLQSINYLEIAAQVRRGDKEPLDEELMHAVWRGLVLNMFHFEDEEMKLQKLAEEDWASVIVQSDIDEPDSQRRGLEQLDEGLEEEEPQEV